MEKSKKELPDSGLDKKDPISAFEPSPIPHHRSQKHSPMHFVSSIIREVTLTVNAKQRNFGRRSTPLEALLGIIPVNNFNKDKELSEQNSSELIIIQALVPGSNASKHQDIHIGEYLNTS